MKALKKYTKKVTALPVFDKRMVKKVRPLKQYKPIKLFENKEIAMAMDKNTHPFSSIKGKTIERANEIKKIRKNL